MIMHDRPARSWQRLACHNPLHRGLVTSAKVIVAVMAGPPLSVTCTNLACVPSRSPRQATTSRARETLEHSRGFYRLVKWRTDSVGRISYLERGTRLTAGREPRFDAGTGSSPTTWSRSSTQSS